MIKASRRNFLIGASALALLHAGWMPHGRQHVNVTWDRLVTNGGGLLPGLSIADDGTKVCYTDTAGAYLYDDVGGTWKQIASYVQNLNPSQFEWVGYRGMVGLADCQIAPSNSNVIYYLMSDLWYNNRIGRAFLSKSSDKGLTSNITSYPQNTQVDATGALIFSSNNDTFKRVQCKIGIDPVNENVVYVSFPGGQSLVTFDGGATFSNIPNLPVGTTTTPGACCFQFDRSSGTTTVNGQTVTNTIYCTVEGSGTWRSTNGGVSFSQISSSFGAQRPGYCAISADGAYYISDIQTAGASVVGGTGGVASTTLSVSAVNSGALNPGAPVTGTGLPGGTFIVKQLSGTPGGVGDYQISSSATVTNGTTITFASNTYNLLSRYQSGAWAIIWQTQAAIGAGTFRPRIAVAAHPTVNGTVVVVNSSGTPHYLASSDYGATWTLTNKTSENVTPSTECPWYTTAISNPSTTYSSQQCVFNRSDGKLYLNYGQGMVRSDVTVGVVPTWEAFNVGIEQTVCYGTYHQSGVPLLQIVNDELAFQHAYPSGLQTPPTEQVGGIVALRHGWTGCIDPYNPQNQVIQGYQVTNGASAWYYTTDGGTTWNLMANVPNQAGAPSPNAIWQAYTATQIKLANGVCIWAPSASSSGGVYRYNMWRSTDFGATPWVELDNSHFNNGADIPVVGACGWGIGNVIPKQTIAFDQVNPNKVYACNWLYQTPPAIIKGLYKSTDAGVTWTYLPQTDVAPSSAISFQSVLMAPGLEDVGFASVGYNATQPPPNTANFASLHKTTDGWATFSRIDAIKEVNFMGFGKAGPSGLPTLYIAGFYNLVYGIYMSPDLGSTWIQLLSADSGPWPLRNDAVYGIDGDKDVFGRCYVSFRGSGSAYSTLV